MKELIEFVASRLVDRPEAVTVSEKEEGDTLLLELRVAADDLGKVIGRQGRTARAMRTLLAIPAGRAGRKVRLDIAE